MLIEQWGYEWGVPGCNTVDIRVAEVCPMTRPFRFGVQSYGASSPQDWRDQARRAEALGFSTFSVADHVIGPGPALAATNHPVQDVAADPGDGRRRRGHRHDPHRLPACSASTTASPVMLAKELATLDFFSGGRLEIGIGAGWLQGEYEAMGVAVRPRRRAPRPAGGDDRPAPGQLRRRRGRPRRRRTSTPSASRACPKPAAAAVPPIMIGGGSERVLGIAGREADIVSLNFDNCSGKIGAGRRRQQHGRADRARRSSGSAPVPATASTTSRSRSAPTSPSSPTTAAARSRRWRRCSASSPRQFAEHPHALIGSVDSICDQLEERRDPYGISYVTFPARMVAPSPRSSPAWPAPDTPSPARSRLHVTLTSPTMSQDRHESRNQPSLAVPVRQHRAVLPLYDQVGFDSYWSPDHILGVFHPGLWADIPLSSIWRPTRRVLRPVLYGAASAR